MSVDQLRKLMSVKHQSSKIFNLNTIATWSFLVKYSKFATVDASIHPDMIIILQYGLCIA